MRRFCVFLVTYEHISHLGSSISIVNFKQVNADWVDICFVYKEFKFWFGFFLIFIATDLLRRLTARSQSKYSTVWYCLM